MAFLLPEGLYFESWDPKVVVGDVVKVLDYLDAHEQHAGHIDIHRMMVADVSMCLVERSNRKLLAYLLCIDRYHESRGAAETMERLECVFSRLKRL